MCEIGAIMEKDEQYARGWIKLYFEKASQEDVKEMAQYKLGISRLINDHVKRCPLCQAEDEVKRQRLLRSA